MRWTHEQYVEYLKREQARKPSDLSARESFDSKPQPAVCHEPVAEKAGEGANPKRFRVCVTGFRRRLCDPDNLCPKYFIDCLRYAKIIPDDSAKHIILTVEQFKVRNSNEERTEITIT